MPGIQKHLAMLLGNCQIGQPKFNRARTFVYVDMRGFVAFFGKKIKAIAAQTQRGGIRKT
jgi:hypothetical protein